MLWFFRKNKRAYTPGEAAALLAEIEPLGWSGEEAKLVLGELVKTGKLRIMGRGLWKGKMSSP